MKKLFTVSLLAGLLSMPSIVLAEATLYGAIHTGVENDASGMTGVADFGSRWGIKGSNEVSEGLSAVYQYERNLDSTDASDPGGRLSYVGLSGGFGTITVGQLWGAAYNHFGGIVDQALNYGSSGATGARFSDALSYAVSVGSVSLQADAIMDQSTKKSGDAYNFGATVGVGESGNIAIAYRKHKDAASVNAASTTAMMKKSSSFIAGNYSIGGMTMFLGYSHDSMKDAGCTQAYVDADTDDGEGVSPLMCDLKSKTKTTFVGVHGGVGETGVNYVFTARSEKMKSNGFTEESDESSASASKKSPWTLGLSRSLGGGATVKFEHGDPGVSGKKASTGLWLVVGF